MNEDTDKSAGEIETFQAQVFCGALCYTLFLETHPIDDIDSLGSITRAANSCFNSYRKATNVTQAKEDIIGMMFNVKAIIGGNVIEKTTNQQYTAIKAAERTSGLTVTVNADKGNIASCMTTLTAHQEEVDEMIYPKSEARHMNGEGQWVSSYNFKQYGLDSQRFFALLRGCNKKPAQKGGSGRAVGPVVLLEDVMNQTGTDAAKVRSYKEKALKKVKTQLKHIPQMDQVIDKFLNMAPGSEEAKQWMNVVAWLCLAFGTREVHKIEITPWCFLRWLNPIMAFMAQGKTSNDLIAAFKANQIDRIHMGGHKAWARFLDLEVILSRKIQINEDEANYFALCNIVAMLGNAARGNLLLVPMILDGVDIMAANARPTMVRKDAMKNGGFKVKAKMRVRGIKRWCKLSSAAPAGQKGEADQIAGLNVFSGKHVQQINPDWEEKLEGSSNSGYINPVQMMQKAKMQLTKVAKGNVVWGTTSWKSWNTDESLCAELEAINPRAFLGWAYDFDAFDLVSEGGTLVLKAKVVDDTGPANKRQRQF